MDAGSACIGAGELEDVAAANEFDEVVELLLHARGCGVEDEAAGELGERAEGIVLKLHPDAGVGHFALGRGEAEDGDAAGGAVLAKGLPVDGAVAVLTVGEDEDDAVTRAGCHGLGDGGDGVPELVGFFALGLRLGCAARRPGVQELVEGGCDSV